MNDALKRNLELYSSDMLTPDGTISFGMFAGNPRWLPYFLFERAPTLRSKDRTVLFETTQDERDAFPELDNQSWVAFRAADGTLYEPGRVAFEVRRAEDYLLQDEAA